VPEYPDKPSNKATTAISREVLKRIADAHVNAPEGFTVHPKVLPQLQRRAGAITDGPIDWGTGEILAFASLLLDGRPVRLAGQDSRRGTFVQRFATIPAVGVRRPRVRVRLLGGASGGARAVGGAVR
jgi:2-oxoglutarate dehydrogenase E1 component